MWMLMLLRHLLRLYRVWRHIRKRWSLHIRKNTTIALVNWTRPWRRWAKGSARPTLVSISSCTRGLQAFSRYREMLRGSSIPLKSALVFLRIFKLVRTSKLGFRMSSCGKTTCSNSTWKIISTSRSNMDKSLSMMLGHFCKQSPSKIFNFL